MSVRAQVVALAAAVMLIAVSGNTAFAHRLNVFASVQSGVVVVEAKYASGRRPKSGKVEIFNGSDALVGTYKLASNGELRVPLAELDAATGLRIVVKAGKHHEDYWVLTPADIAKQTGS